jgi:hypothetical protein
MLFQPPESPDDPLMRLSALIDAQMHERPWMRIFVAPRERRIVMAMAGLLVLSALGLLGVSARRISARPAPPSSR